MIARPARDALTAELDSRPKGERAREPANERAREPANERAREPANERARAALAWIAVAAWCAAIFAASALPARAMPAGRLWHLDKLAHAAVYGVLGALLLHALRASALRAAAAARLAVALSALYAVTDEWHQSFVPGRNPSAGDLLADTLGAFAACALLCGLAALRARPGG